MSDFFKGFFIAILLSLMYEILDYFKRKREAKKCNYICENCKYFPCNKWDCEREKQKQRRNK